MRSRWRPRSCWASRCRSAAQWIRVLFAEITRVLNHLLNVTTYALDVGAITPSLWGFEEREKLMEFHEAASGARLHANYFRPGGVSKDLPAGLEATDRRMGRDVSEVHRRPGRAADRQPHLEAAHGRYRRDGRRSRRWPGALPARVCARRGVPWDLRRAQPYDKYAEVEFQVPVGRNGDCYDRYLMRLAEMRESVKIIQQCLAKMQPGPVKVQDHKFSPPTRAGDEALDGGADPSLQAVYRGLSRAGRAPPTPRWKARRASSACIWSPMEPTGRIAARSARPGSRFLQAIDVMAKRHMLADAVRDHRIARHRVRRDRQVDMAEQHRLRAAGALRVRRGERGGDSADPGEVSARAGRRARCCRCCIWCRTR